MHRTPQIAQLACRAFAEFLYLLQRTALRGGRNHENILTRNCFGTVGQASGLRSASWANSRYSGNLQWTLSNN